MRSKNLQQIIQYIDYEVVSGDLNKTITKITSDSRKVVNNAVFVAIEGTQVDGHSFINEAKEKGANVIVISKKIPANIDRSITVLRVRDTRESLSQMLAAYYDYPSQRMKIIGITGTNGKTTTATVLYNLYRKLGYKSGLISTVENRIIDEILPSTHTTPDPEQLYELLYKMYQKGVQYVFMETSSHSLVQKRVYAVDFDGAVFTNLTHDHLDYHKDLKDYLNAKKILFDNLKAEAFALVNADDKHHSYIIQNTKARKYTYGLKGLSDFKAKIFEKHFDGTLVLIDKQEVWLQFVGSFNVYNLLAVYGVATLLGENKNEILEVLSELKPVRGRFQTIYRNGKYGIVDYAHTPDALENILKELKTVAKSTQRIITVIGAGGNRDKKKRPKMAAIAQYYSDIVILTSDNPRFEDPMQILNDMQKGLDKTRDNYLIIENRQQAIKTAIMTTKPGDLVLVAGKGHETYQEINGKKIHFDDMEILKKYL